MMPVALTRGERKLRRNRGTVYLVETASGKRIQDVPLDLTGLDPIGRWERLHYVEDELMLGRDPREYRVDYSELESG